MSALELRRQTIARGELEKINLDGCKGCPQVYVSSINALRLAVSPGWHDLFTLPQGPNGKTDRVIRVRGRRWGGVMGQRTCPSCKSNGVN